MRLVCFLLRSFNRTTNRLLKESRRPFEDFASSGYPQLPGLIVELRLLSRRVSHLWAEIQQDPARFFLTDRQNGYAAPR